MTSSPPRMRSKSWAEPTAIRRIKRPLIAEDSDASGAGPGDSDWQIILQGHECSGACQGSVSLPSRTASPHAHFSTVFLFSSFLLGFAVCVCAGRWPWACQSLWRASVRRVKSSTGPSSSAKKCASDSAKNDREENLPLAPRSDRPADMYRK